MKLDKKYDFRYDSLLSSFECDCGFHSIHGRVILAHMKQHKIAEFDPVTKPKGYNQGTIECSDYIMDQKLDFFSGNVVKYIVRHKFKNGLEDLNKAQWYLNYLIKEYESGE